MSNREELKMRFLTTYRHDTDKIEAFTEQDDYKKAVDLADEWVWQYAETEFQAIIQHIQKMDEYEINPNKYTY